MSNIQQKRRNNRYWQVFALNPSGELDTIRTQKVLKDFLDTARLKSLKLEKECKLREVALTGIEPVFRP